MTTINPAITRIMGVQNDIKKEASDKGSISNFMMKVTQQEDDQKENKNGNEIDSSSKSENGTNIDENKKSSGFSEFVRPARDSNKPKYVPNIKPSSNFMETPI